MSVVLKYTEHFPVMMVGCILKNVIFNYLYLRKNCKNVSLRRKAFSTVFSVAFGYALTSALVISPDFIQGSKHKKFLLEIFLMDRKDSVVDSLNLSC